MYELVLSSQSLYFIFPFEFTLHRFLVYKALLSSHYYICIPHTMLYHSRSCIFRSPAACFYTYHCVNLYVPSMIQSYYTRLGNLSNLSQVDRKVER